MKLSSVKTADKTTILIFTFILIVIIIIGFSTYGIFNILSTHNETNVLVDTHNMTKELKFNHVRVFPDDELCSKGMTYVFWIYIQNWDYSYGKLKYILNKGYEFNTKNMNTTDTLLYNESMPAIFLDEKEPSMIFTFRESSNIESAITGSTSSVNSNDSQRNEPYRLNNLPVRKWFHIGLTMYQNMIEVYKDGALVDTVYVGNEFEKNYAPLHLAENGGFAGYISKLAAFPHVLNEKEILQKYLSGPSEIQIDNSEYNVDANCDTNNGNNGNNKSGNGSKDIQDHNMGNDDTWNLQIDPTLTFTSGSSNSISVQQNAATFYSRPNMHLGDGSNVSLPIGYYTKSDLAQMGITPGTISGVSMNPGYLVTLYENDVPTETDRIYNYVILRNDTDWNGAMKHMNNKTNSLKIEKDPFVNKLFATFYQRQNFSGWEVSLPLGNYTQNDLKIHGFHPKELSSFKIDVGYQVRLYNEDNFKGEYIVVSGNKNQIEKSFNDKTISLILEKTKQIAPMPVFYTEHKYKGFKTRLNFGNYTMYDLIQKDFQYSDLDSSFIIKSIHVPKGINLLLYPKDHFIGIPQRLEEDARTLSEKLYMLSVIKSIKVVKADAPKWSFTDAFSSCNIM
jgi:hypothetical protein